MTTQITMAADDTGGGAADEAGRQIRVFLLDDHEIVRRGVADLIDAEDDLLVVGQWGGAMSAPASLPSDA
jgi:hypothetical protein